MKQKILSIISFLILGIVSNAQNNLSDVLKTYNSESIPYITVEELEHKKKDVLVLDAREIEEYNVSHLKDAIYVGYEDFNSEETANKLKDKSKTIVVYCSIGVRSEDVAEKLVELGYNSVYNLHGGLFEWKNQNKQVYNLKNQPTDSVHAYSKRWGKWLKKGIKVYE